MPAALLLMFAMLTTPTSPGAVSSYVGIARADARGAVIYRERHYRYGSAGDPHELVLYTCPDGKAFARKTVGGGASAQAPDFAMRDARSGYREGVREQDGKRQVYVRKVGADSTHASPLPDVKHAVIDSGFDAFVRAHWKALVGGKTLKMDFLVPSRGKYMHFEVYRRDSAAAKKRGEVEFRLRLSSWLGFALPHIDVGYSADTHELRWFRGLSNVRDVHGENINVSLRYPKNKRGVHVSAAELEAARKQALNGQCKLH